MHLWPGIRTHAHRETHIHAHKCGRESASHRRLASFCTRVQAIYTEACGASVYITCYISNAMQKKKKKKERKKGGERKNQSFSVLPSLPRASCLWRFVLLYLYYGPHQFACLFARFALFFVPAPHYSPRSFPTLGYYAISRSDFLLFREMHQQCHQAILLFVSSFSLRSFLWNLIFRFLGLIGFALELCMFILASNAICSSKNEEKQFWRNIYRVFRSQSV